MAMTGFESRCTTLVLSTRIRLPSPVVRANAQVMTALNVFLMVRIKNGSGKPEISTGRSRFTSPPRLQAWIRPPRAGFFFSPSGAMLDRPT